MAALDTGVIHQHINLANVFFDMLDGGINVLFMRNIERRGNGADPFLLQFGDGGLRALWRNIIDDNLRAIFTQPGRQ